MSESWDAQRTSSGSVKYSDVKVPTLMVMMQIYSDRGEKLSVFGLKNNSVAVQCFLAVFEGAHLKKKIQVLAHVCFGVKFRGFLLLLKFCAALCVEVCVTV